MLTRFRYRVFTDHLIGEILSKRWTDNAIPFIALILVVAVFGVLTPSMFSLAGLFDLSTQVSDFAIVTMAMTIVVLSGGIDLSIGSIFAICAMTILTALNVYDLPLP